MFSLPLDTLFFYITPLITGMFLLLISLYLILVRKHRGADFPLYACFLLCFVIFLLGRPLQFYSGPILAHLIMYARFIILFSIGFPSLLNANRIRCGMTLSHFSMILPYVLGSLGAVVFLMVRDGCTLQILFSQKYGYMLPLMFTEATYSDILIIVTTALLVFPSLFLIHFHLHHNRQMSTLIILSSSLFLGVVYIGGEILNLYWPFYLGSLVTVFSWVKVIYLDIRSTPLIIDSLLNCHPLAHNNASVSDAPVFGSREIIGNNLLNDEIEFSAIAGKTPTIKNRELADKAISYIKANFNREMELPEIASYVDVSDSYLIRTFKKVTGKTINQYITSYRVQQAQRLLKKHSVVETSLAVGFKSPSYFSTVFKKSTGLSPLQFQNQHT